MTHIHGMNVAFSQLSERIKYNENLVPDEEGNYKHLVLPNQVIHEGLFTRTNPYSLRLLERPSSGLSNVVLDSFFPRLMYNYNMNIAQLRLDESFPRTACAISPLVAECLNVKRIQTEQLCRVLGYDTKAIKALIDTVRAKKINIVFCRCRWHRNEHFLLAHRTMYNGSCHRPIRSCMCIRTRSYRILQHVSISY